MTQSRNEVLLEGLPLALPVRSHENHGTVFYRFFLEVPRLSGTPDVLPMVLPEALVEQVREAPRCGCGDSCAPSTTAAAWATNWC